MSLKTVTNREAVTLLRSCPGQRPVTLKTGPSREGELGIRNLTADSLVTEILEKDRTRSTIGKSLRAWASLARATRMMSLEPKVTN